MKEKNKVFLIEPQKLKPNATKLSIYSQPENYDAIKENIKSQGILEPLIVNGKTKMIISGNLRLQIALELGIKKIPVIFETVEDEEMDITSVSTNQARNKLPSEILKEMKFFEDHYKVKKGQRTDLDPDLHRLKNERDEMLRSIPRESRRKLKNIDSMAAELYGQDSTDYKRVFNELDSSRSTLNGMHQHLMDRIKSKKNAEVVPDHYELLTENVQIYNTSSADMFQLADKSVNSIITSPPYFQMRDYNTGDKQIGQEREIDAYLENLIDVFKECYRVLRDDGSCFVNINDCVIDGKYQVVPQRFVLAMLKIGFWLNDELLWIKRNPTYTRGPRSVRAHEPIFHFVKSDKFYYDDSWLNNLIDEDSLISYGTQASNPKVISGLDFRESVLKTNVANTSEMRKLCRAKGFHLTHSATFPIDVPTICALLTTKNGDTILDCFSGTSTVGEFARRNNRKYIGYELNPEYVMAAEVRLSQEGCQWHIPNPEAWNYINHEHKIVNTIVDHTKPNALVLPVSPSNFKTFFKDFNSVFADYLEIFSVQ